MKDAVGPVLRMCDELELVLQAIVEDNPGREIETIDHGSYVRVQASGSLRLTLASLRRKLGASFEMRHLESMLSSFAGRIATSSEGVSWTLVNEKSGEAAGKGGGTR